MRDYQISPVFSRNVIDRRVLPSILIHRFLAIPARKINVRVPPLPCPKIATKAVKVVHPKTSATRIISSY
jgi:hypothetical protein